MTRLTKLAGAVVLGGGLVLSGLGFLGSEANAQPKPGAEKRERHPHIRRALHELREARKELKEAAHDFGGHREDAVEAINVAIKQLELALKYDKK
jgi:hypothetical protein